MAYEYPHVQIKRTSAMDYSPFVVLRHGRHWEVRDPSGEVVCITVYRRGAAEVVRRLKLSIAPNQGA